MFLIFRHIPAYYFPVVSTMQTGPKLLLSYPLYFYHNEKQRRRRQINLSFELVIFCLIYQGLRVGKLTGAPERPPRQPAGPRLTQSHYCSVPEVSGREAAEPRLVQTAPVSPPASAQHDGQHGAAALVLAVAADSVWPLKRY